jgi:ribonuclease HII
MSIAAASILAKCHRDDIVCQLTLANPELAKYGFDSHKGYGTKKHMDALKAYGVTQYHRKTFGPVAALVQRSPT